MHKALLSFFFPPSQAEQLIAQYTPETFLASIPTTLTPLGDSMFTLCPYHHDVVRPVIWALKYHHSTHAAQLLAHALYPQLQNLFPTTPITIVPMPRSSERIATYGYNQIELLTKALLTIDTTKRIHVNANVLKRKRHTPHQTSLARRHDRMTNVQNTFCIKNSNIPHDNHVVIFDDVITTGATMREARKTLYTAKLSPVTCIGIAY